MRREVQDSILILGCNNILRAIFTHTPTKSCLNIGGLNDWAGLAPHLLGGSSLKAYRSLRLWDWHCQTTSCGRVTHYHLPHIALSATPKALHSKQGHPVCAKHDA